MIRLLSSHEGVVLVAACVVRNNGFLGSKLLLRSIQQRSCKYDVMNSCWYFREGGGVSEDRICALH